MNNTLLPSINIPCTLFETISLFDNYSADDMQYGDMVEQDFLSLGLSDISAKVDPYRLIKYHFPGPGSINVAFSASSSGTKISQRECTDILFAEMKELAKMFSFFGQYKTLIEDLIEHFRYGNGINSTPSTGYQPLILQSIKTKLLSSRLNKFNDFEDSFNGLGISVHDISAQKISLLSFQKYAIGWSATIHFVAQDHFGLDVTDIKNKTYSKYRFFRIWFFLQRHKDFAFKPFFTNFNTIERIENYL
ncbi:DUF3289 family protein [Escherichia coli]|nr:DUF3289 family protein [Escherichia coli]